MKPTTWIQTRWTRLLAARKADMPALTVERAKEIVARHPECGPAWKMLGSALVELARYDEAETALRRATALCPADAIWIPLAEMGHLFKARGDLATAASWYHRAAAAAPDEAGAWIFLGGALAQAGRLDEAAAAHGAAVHCKHGCRDEAYLNLGLVLRALGRLDEAAACFEAALELDPRYKAAKLALRDVRQAVRADRRQPAAASPRRRAAVA